MSSLFSKPLENLDIHDIEKLIEEGYPEGTFVEYKRELPSKKPNGDPWLQGDAGIGDYARNQLLEEVVAFANGQGGYLILGLEESNDKPPRASKVRPISRCAELAEKLRLQARDCISPKLPQILCQEIVCEGDGAGLIIIYTPQSRLAPHRLEPTSQCYLRRNDRSEKMTMREIQELTVQRTRFSSDLDDKFLERHNMFEKHLQRNLINKVGYGIRATLIPSSSEVWIPRVHNNQDIKPVQKTFDALIGETRKRLDFFDNFYTTSSRPILRGSRYVNKTERYVTIQEIYCDGMIEYTFSIKHERAPGDRLMPSWIYSILINAILTAFQFRKVAGFPDVEYELEFEVRGMQNNCQINQFPPGDQSLILDNNPLIFPRLSVGLIGDLPEAIKIFHRDLWDSAGVEWYPNFEIEIPEEY